MLGENIHKKICLWSCFVISVGLPLGEFFMSVGTISLFINWLIEANFKEKIKRLKNNFLGLAIISIFLIHVVGLLWTSDFNYGLHDIKIKLPIFIIPLVLGSISYLDKKNFLTIFLVFVAATFISTLISVGIYINLKWVEKSLQNHRDISIFISHIRLSLMVVFSIVGLFYFLKQQQVKKGYVFALSLYFSLFLILLQSLTGLAFLVMFSVLFPMLWNSFNTKHSLSSLALFFSFLITAFIICAPFYSWYFVPQEKPVLKQPSLGNFYHHDLNNHQLENGFYVWRNINDSGLKDEWKNRSTISIDSTGKTHQPIKATLIRYLTSKHLTKDAEGVKQLSEEDILDIENGAAHFKKHSSIFNRIDEFFFELSALKNKQNPSNNSFGQRLFAWNLSFEIIKNNFLFGVGTGDVSNTFNKKYSEQETIISKQIRAHNQILTFFIAFGVLSLIPLMAILYFTFKKSELFNGLKLLFMIIILCSFLFEDTLETQAGVTFFAFFSGLFSTENPSTKSCSSDSV